MAASHHGLHRLRHQALAPIVRMQFISNLAAPPFLLETIEADSTCQRFRAADLDDPGAALAGAMDLCHPAHGTLDLRGGNFIGPVGEPRYIGSRQQRLKRRYIPWRRGPQRQPSGRQDRKFPARGRWHDFLAWISLSFGKFASAAVETADLRKEQLFPRRRL